MVNNQDKRTGTKISSREENYRRKLIMLSKIGQHCGAFATLPSKHFAKVECCNRQGKHCNALKKCCSSVRKCYGVGQSVILLGDKGQKHRRAWLSIIEIWAFLKNYCWPSLISSLYIFGSYLTYHSSYCRVS